MSDELRLPDRLAACEAELAAQPLAASTINRDELLYRAGWAAAEAAWSRRGEAGVTPSAAPRKAIAIWSIASAAAAAGLAAAVTWSVAASTQPDAIAMADVEHPSSVGAAAKTAERPPRPAVVEQQPAPRDAVGGQDAWVRRDASALPLWFVSRQGRLGLLEQRGLAASDMAALTPAGGKSATARQLLNEYLPVRDADGAGRATPAHSILNFLHPQAWKGDAI